MNSTSIEWCNRPETRGPAGAKTWNPIRAKRIYAAADRDLKPGTFCTRISPGCTHCYASTINKRFGNGLEYTVPNLSQVEFFISETILEQPLRQKKPCTIFVGDMFDLFHEAIPFEMIGRVFQIMHEAERHTFQLLTKRAARMKQFHEYRRPETPQATTWGELAPDHLWLGVSVEDQQRADERITLLLETPAAVRFLSIEPMLEAVNLSQLSARDDSYYLDSLRGIYVKKANGNDFAWLNNTCTRYLIDWVICGGESGPGARPFNLAWAESLLEQCRAAGVPFFMKQIGSFPLTSEGVALRVRDRKGGDPDGWPAALRVREFPTLNREAVTA